MRNKVSRWGDAVEQMGLALAALRAEGYWHS